MSRDHCIKVAPYLPGTNQQVFIITQTEGLLCNRQRSELIHITDLILKATPLTREGSRDIAPISQREQVKPREADNLSRVTQLVGSGTGAPAQPGSACRKCYSPFSPSCPSRHHSPTRPP